MSVRENLRVDVMFQLITRDTLYSLFQIVMVLRCEEILLSTAIIKQMIKKLK